MSQHENVEKLTRARTEVLKIRQADFAQLIGIDRSYLSRLENGHEEIQPWILKKVDELVQQNSVTNRTLSTPAAIGLRPEFRGESCAVPQTREMNEPPDALTMRDPAQAYRASVDTKAECERYLREFLERCANDPDRLSWTKIELHEKFPLTKWEK